MRLSRRSKYALLALFDLAGRSSPVPVPLKELAEGNNIPYKFLEQIFRDLRSAGIVHSQVGAHGGYTLGRPAAEITLGTVIRLLDGTLAPVSCVSQIAYEPCTCLDERTCPVRAVMGRVRQAIVAVVDNTTLADVSAGRFSAENDEFLENGPVKTRKTQKAPEKPRRQR
jgi:Rrf2 family protein